MSHSCVLQSRNPNHRALQPHPGSLLLGTSEGLVEVEETALCRKLEGGTPQRFPPVTGRRWSSTPEHAWLRGPEEIPTSTTGMGRPSPKLSPQPGLPRRWPVGSGRGFLAEAMPGLPPPYPCRGSRWPCCREGVGRSNRGRGLGEETEPAKQSGGGGQAAGRRLFRSKCARNANELRSFMASCLPNWGASQVLEWRNWG